MKIAGDAAGSMQQVVRPAGTLKTGEALGEGEVYHDNVTVLVKVPNTQVLTIGWEGCADAGGCYPPQTWPYSIARAYAADSAEARRDRRHGRPRFSMVPTDGCLISVWASNRQLRLPAN